ncbi:cip1-interacting zinc finger protein [Anomaloglossus baeobatrachus]|uniref:cip1-interacting zinc finger protein n=1 Tax=Anomaloglossus baeobatrachus TaxID=238106 RepID=UPI003F508170
MAKRSLRPFCTVCSRHFKTPRKFVEHMKSPEHKQKSQELKLLEKETWSPEESEELITVDAVGCFEEDEEDDNDDDDEAISADDISEDTEGLMDKVEDNDSDHDKEEEEYNADTDYGLDYMVPVAGYLCRLCHKFYPSDSAARLAHCKSLVHFQNVQRSKAEKKDDVTLQDAEDDSGRMTIADQTDEEPVAVQDGDDKEASAPVAGEEGISASGDTEDSVAGFDTVIGTSEEDSSFLLDQEMFLDPKEDEEDDVKEEEEDDVKEEEEEGAQYIAETSAPCTRRSTLRRRVR